MGLTTDRNDPGLRQIKADGQQAAYLILSEEERQKGFMMPVYRSYRHMQCGSDTHMGLALCETFARDPKFYGGTFCCHCRAHFPLQTAEGPQFYWVADNGERTVPVGSGPDELLTWWEEKRQREAEKRMGEGI
jgi:hypothetical protein